MWRHGKRKEGRHAEHEQRGDHQCRLENCRELIQLVLERLETS